MFDDIELKNCPEKYALNCKRYMVECHNCKANDSGKYLKYLPINKSISNHPINNKQKSKSPSYSRKGRVKEKKFINNNSHLKSTYASGMIGGDGDAYIQLKKGQRIRVEIKTRYTEKGSIKPTSKEYLESKNQGVKIIFILQDALNRERAYIKFDLFINIFQTLVSSPEIVCESIKEKDSVLYLFRNRFNEYGVVAITDKNPCYSFKIKDYKRGTNKYNHSYSNVLEVMLNNHGHYIAMERHTFDELIDLYNYVLDFI